MEMKMARMYHGTLHYAVYGRNVGTFGWRAPRSTLKIYDTRDCGTPWPRSHAKIACLSVMQPVSGAIAITSKVS
jgi:hypothetical protein